ncbi:MAG: tetratricopeptide repeat protein [Planctomycetaceae bacterium]|jgi:DNA-directed RNA polymerase subunit alpha|nr:tetratricopeptide repeat protein [Planctomycetaceae bacterium]
MMMTANLQDFDVKQAVLFDGTFGPREIDQLSAISSRDFNQFEVLKNSVQELEAKSDELSPAGFVRLGVCQFLIGKYQEAVQTLKSGDGGALAHFYLARLNFSLGKHEEALHSYDLAQKAGYNVDYCTLGRAETYRAMSENEKSLAELDRLSGAIEQTAEYLYQRGATVAAIGINPYEAIALYERALSADRNHPGALFGLALENERRGNDEEALDLYKRAVGHFPTNVGTLFNIGILYEDFGQYEQAVLCFQRVLDTEPMNKQAMLFLKDAKASSEMHFDEEAQRRRDQMSQILNLPVSDFELSVRSRSCLKNMGINTLADLCRHTEQDLLGSKNFGETSLDEIRNMLTLKGLQLGQLATEKHTPETVEVEALSPDEQATLARPINDLNLSVRARKCMNRLGIQTVGELVRRTADELLECKNFGVTSLKEIREKLTVYNIKLRGE